MARRFEHILVPTDFSQASDAALACAKELAGRLHARLSVLHVVTDPNATGLWTPEVYMPARPEVPERLLREARARIEKAFTPVERERFRLTIEARIGSAADTIHEFALERMVDMIVMGTHGRSGLAHLLLGSVAESVLRRAPCPVVTTHAEARPHARQTSSRQPASRPTHAHQA